MELCGKYPQPPVASGEFEYGQLVNRAIDESAQGGSGGDVRNNPHLTDEYRKSLFPIEVVGDKMEVLSVSLNPAQPSPSWEGTINDAPFTAPDCWSKFDKDLRHTLDAFFNDMSEGAVATIKQHVRELLLSERERIVVEVEKIIERERFAGAPHALNEVIKLLRQS